MTQSFSSVSEHALERGYRAVTLENEFLSITLLPEKGADIYRFVYKPREMDVLWKAPWGLKHPGTGVPTAANSSDAWLEHYPGGWQEIFPNGGDACVYKGCHLNMHGEVSILPWDFTLKKGNGWVSAEFTVSTYRSPFLLRRTMIVEDGKPLVRIIEKITNRAEEEMHYMWGHHPAYGAPFLDGNCHIQLPGATFQANSIELSPLCKIAANTEAAWPLIPGKQGPVDLREVPSMTQRNFEFGYLRDLQAGWYALTSRKYDFSVALVWPHEVFPYLWFWQELRGSFGFPWYGNCYVMAIEPFTSMAASLERALAAGTAPVIGPGQSTEVELTALFIPGQAIIHSISGDGRVETTPGI